MRIILHGFGSFPVVFWHLIECFQKSGAGIEWAIILSTDHHRKKFVELLGEDRVFVLPALGDCSSNLEASPPYPGPFFADLEAEKRTYKSMKGREQTARGIEIYCQARSFMAGFSPTHAMVSQVEGFDGKAFIAAAREIGAKIVVPTGLRNFGGAFFSSDDKESLPPYAFQNWEKFRDEASRIVEQFSRQHLPANQAIEANGLVLPSFTPPLSQRLMGSLRRWTSQKGAFQWDFLRASLLNNLPGFRDAIWKIRTLKNQRYCSLRKVNDLPPQFVFYPLQYSPESSINTPAPYYLDQLRAIDAIRFALPSNYRLVVKEHPSCILIRPGSFCRRLSGLAGVEVAHVRIPAREIIRRADLTISVTGTAALEAFLLGKPSLCMGPSFFAGFLGGPTGIDNLSDRICQALGREVSIEERVKAVSCIFNARYEHNFSSPGTPGEPVLRDANIKLLHDNLLDHLERMIPFEQPFA